MDTMCWTRTSERGFEWLPPVRLTVSLFHRWRSLTFVWCFWLWGGGFCLCLVGLFVWVFCLCLVTRSSSFDRGWATAICCLPSCFLTSRPSQLSWRVPQGFKKNTERVGSELHRVDEINLVEKFQTIAVGDPKRRWLVNSGATCHIISERWLSHYQVVYKYDVGIPVLKGAGDNILPTRGMVDLECKVGQTKVIMRKVVICALDLNILTSYSLHEQGWETRLGTLKVRGLYHKKV